jgi:hypothetical protein
MKITHVLSSLIVSALILTISSCGPDPAPDAPIEEQQLAKLATTWKISEVKLDDVSKKSDYPNFQLVISGTPGASSFGYTASGRPASSPWPASGTWTFGANPETQIVRDSGADKIDITYAVSDDGSKLQLSFDFSGVGYQGSRVSNVKGKWVFNFTK